MGASYFRHLLADHAGTTLSGEQAGSLAWLLRRCGVCGLSGRAGSSQRCAGCRAGPDESRGVRGGDIITASIDVGPPSRDTRARPVVDRLAARRVRGTSHVGVTPALRDVMGQLDLDMLRAAAAELRAWSGSETMVNVPVRCRADLAVVFGDLLMAMTAGDVRAGLLLRIAPKLLLHRSGSDPGAFGAAAGVILRRLTLFCRGRIAELLAVVREDRLSASRKRTATRKRLSARGAATGRVKAFARAGAFSKAVKMLTSSIADLDTAAVRRWALELLPGAPTDLPGAGACPVSAEERLRLAGVRTCAKEILRAEADESPAAGMDVDEDGDAGVEGESTGGASLAMSAAAAAAAVVQDLAGSVPAPSSAGAPPPPGRAPPPARGRRPKPRAYAHGVRFGALSAPGPSGLRAEHIRALELARKAAAAKVFQKGMAGFVAAAISGTLPRDACGWLLDSAVVFIEKPGAGPDGAPRPLRVGEVLRRWVAKRVFHAEKDRAARLLARARQFGVAIPGGAEVLLHYRALREAFAGGGGLGDTAVGVWDNDWVNCFCLILWPRIDAAVAEYLPGALPWTRWCHEDPVTVVLPGGALHVTDRGAEQGDPLGPAYAAAAIAHVVREATSLARAMLGDLAGKAPTHAAMLEAVSAQWRRAAQPGAPDCGYIRRGLQRLEDLVAAKGVTVTDGAALWDAAVLHAPAVSARPANAPLRLVDTWYLDDSDCWGDLLDGDLFLAAVDLAGWRAGMHRNARKSSFCALGAAAGRPAPPWTQCTTPVRTSAEPYKVLGVQLRVHDAITQFDDRTKTVAAIHELIGGIADPAIELVLVRQCAEVNRVTYLLRALGPELARAPGVPVFPALPAELLAKYDRVMDGAVANVVGGEVDGDALEQASWGVRTGGLGLRRATAIALPAHVASLVDAGPLVDFLCAQAAAAGVPCAGAGFTHAARTELAVDHLLGDIPDGEVATAVRAAIDMGATAAQAAAGRLLGDTPVAPSPPGEAVPTSIGGGSGSVVADVGVEDDEHPRSQTPGGSRGATARGGSSQLQHRIVEDLDRFSHERALLDAEADGSEDGCYRAARLRDLSSPNSAHDWLWAINPAHGEVLAPRHFLTALRLRLGLSLTSDYSCTMPCNGCGVEVTAAAFPPHALLCARGERTLGHNRVRDLLATYCKMVDGRTRVEVAVGPAAGGAIDASDEGLRPADVLTSAAPLGGCGVAALDVGITAPFTERALRDPGHDVLASYAARKRDTYGRVCGAAGWHYYPLIISAFGRRDDTFEAVVRRICLAAQRRVNGGDPDRMAAGFWRRTGTIIMERNALMVERCRPVGLAARAHVALAGGVDEDRLDCEPLLEDPLSAATEGGALVGGFYGSPVPGGGLGP